jgi:hypothetical protein
MISTLSTPFCEKKEKNAISLICQHIKIVSDQLFAVINAQFFYSWDAK